MKTITLLTLLALQSVCFAAPSVTHGDSRGKAAWTIDNGEISLTVTEQGTQTAPVVFHGNGAPSSRTTSARGKAKASPPRAKPPRPPSPSTPGCAPARHP